MRMKLVYVVPSSAIFAEFHGRTVIAHIGKRINSCKGQMPLLIGITMWTMITLMNFSDRFTSRMKE
jgi:hypothetical protein